MNVYSESQQRVIPDSGTKELPYKSENITVTWTQNNISTVNPDNGDWKGADVCHCAVGSDLYHACWDYPVVSGSIHINNSQRDTTYRFYNSAGSVVFQHDAQYKEDSSDIANRTETCHDFVPDFGLYTYRRDVISGYATTENIGPLATSYRTQGQVAGTQSHYHPERWILFYWNYSGGVRNLYNETSQGECRCGQIGAICWGGCDCKQGQSKTDYNWENNYKNVMNIGGSERILNSATGSGGQQQSSVCIDGYSTYDYGSPFFTDRHPEAAANLKVQKKRFEDEDTKDAFLGDYMTWIKTGTYDPSGTRYTYQYSNEITVFKYDEMGFIDKTWPYNREAEWHTIQGLLTNFSLTYVRL
jgi:hypothetical protein